MKRNTSPQGHPLADCADNQPWQRRKPSSLAVHKPPFAAVPAPPWISSRAAAAVRPPDQSASSSPGHPRFARGNITCKIDLTGQVPNTNGPLYVQDMVGSANGQQSVQVWSLDQDYAGFSSSVTWNTAQANDTSSGSGLLTAGGFTATPINGSLRALRHGGNDYTHNFMANPWGT